MSSRARHSSVMRRVLFAIFVLLLGGLTATAWYAYNKGFTKSWRAIISEEFRKQGFEVSLRRLTLDPFRGLVAKDVKIFDAKNRRRTLAVVDEVLIGINYANAFQGKKGETFLDTLDLRDANLSLPVDPSNPRGRRVEISKLNARLFLPPQQIYLARAEAEVAGLRVYAAGRVINPQEFRPARGEQYSPALQWLERLIDELDELIYEGEHPLVALQFSGDLARPEKLWVDVRVQGSQIRRRDYRLDTIDLAATLREGQIELQRCDLRDRRGLLQAYANFVPKTQVAEFRMRSSMDLPGMLRSLKVLPRLKDWAFYVPPAIELEGNVKLAGTPKFQLLGNVELQKFAYKSVIFEGLQADASWKGDSWSIRNLHLRHHTGELQGDVIQVPEDFRAHLKSTVNPGLIAPLLSGKAAEWFSRFDLKDAPGFEIVIPPPPSPQEAHATTIEEHLLSVAAKDAPH